MQRYFIPTEQFGEKSVRIIGDDAHHLMNVMRAKDGDQMIVADGSGREAVVQVTALSKAEVLAEIVEERISHGEPSVRVWIAQAMPKGDKMETVIQRGSEIGATRFIPFTSERTIVQYDAKKEGKRLERWARIAKEAAEQAHRGRVPDIDPVRNWRELLKLAGQLKVAFLCYEKESNRHLRGLLRELQNESSEQILLIIGPEGGFSEKEVREAEEAGCVTISLGARILRTETAAMVGLSCILYEYGEIGG